MTHDVPMASVPGGAPCLVCDRPRADFPACFLGDPTCSVNCAKALEAL